MAPGVKQHLPSAPDNTSSQKSDGYDAVNAIGESQSMPLPALQIARRQWVALVLGAIVLWLRKSDDSILGDTIPLTWGTVPLECLLWSYVIVDMVVADILDNINEFFRE